MAENKHTAELRDQFAMAALTGLMANSEGVHAGAEPLVSYLSNRDNAKWLAGRCFAIADAMIAARATQPGEV